MTIEVDDRVTCLMCRHSQQFRCAKLGGGVLVELPRRCVHFVPNASEGDQRTGAQRWPTYDADLAKTRAEDAAHIKAHG